MKHGSGGTLFEPRIPPAVADARHARWKKAVQRSLGLDELAEGAGEEGPRGAEDGCAVDGGSVGCCGSGGGGE